MAPNLVQLHEQALSFMTKVIHGVPDDAWNRQSPCEKWSVRDVVNHITAENFWAEPLMDGKTVEEVGDRFDGDVLGSDPKASWGQAAKEASVAFGVAGATRKTVHVSWGEISGKEYLEQMTTDLIVHGWDIAKGSGQSDEIPTAFVEFVMSALEPLVSSGQTGGVFKSPLNVADDADAQTKMLALTGRAR
jgi:uncharacterized protein (TIGR03086 family)